MRLLTEVVLTIILMIIGVVMLVEFMAGCGETYIDAKGDRHEYGCVIINPTP